MFDIDKEDWIAIEKVKLAFISSFESLQGQYLDEIDVSNVSTAMISWAESSNRLSLRFINFSRQIQEFQQLLLDDRLILTKFNLFPLFPIGSGYRYQPTDHCFSNDYSREPEKQRRFIDLCGIPNTIRNRFVDLVISIVEITEQNSTFISLLSIILILTPGLSMDEEQPALNDSLAVHRVQSHFIKLLWNYLVYQWGNTQAYRRFIKLLDLILRMQSTIKILRLCFRDQCMKSNTVDRIAPLMQSVLNIS